MNVFTQELDLTIEGMTCASCVAHVERALSKVDGVDKVSVNLTTERAHLTLSSPVPVANLIQTVVQAGYNAHLIVVTDTSDTAERREHERLHLAKLFKFSLIATLPVFVLEMGAHLIPAFHHWLMANLGDWNWIIQAVLTTLVMFGPGWVFYQKGLPALARLAPEGRRPAVEAARGAGRCRFRPRHLQQAQAGRLVSGSAWAESRRPGRYPAAGR